MSSNGALQVFDPVLWTVLHLWEYCPCMDWLEKGPWFSDILVTKTKISLPWFNSVLNICNRLWASCSHTSATECFFVGFWPFGSEGNSSTG